MWETVLEYERGEKYLRVSYLDGVGYGLEAILEADSGCYVMFDTFEEEVSFETFDELDDVVLLVLTDR